jgi:uncharacterized phosphosugar-binding protein
MKSFIEDYINLCISQITHLRDRSAASIMAAAQAVADAIQNEKGYFLFGSGHSALIAHEAFWRAGGLAPALPIIDPTEGDAERLPGYAPIVLDHYDLQPGSVIVVISNSGINPLPIEVALECKARGLTVIAITCLSHSQAVASRHPSGRKLFEAADIVIDTQGAPGDAVLDLPGVPGRVGPTSTLLGAAIVEAISVQAAAVLVERGVTPPVLVSANLPEGDAHNRALIEHYRNRLFRRQISTVDARATRS